MNRPHLSLSSLPTLVALMVVAICGVFLCTASGCSDVSMSSTYSDLLDKQAALTQDAAVRSATGQLAPADVTAVLTADAQLLNDLRAARDGTATATPAPPAAPVAPAAPAPASPPSTSP